MKQLLTFVLIALAQIAYSIEFDAYHTQEQIHVFLQQTQKEDPNNRSIVDLGLSAQGRPLRAILFGSSSKPTIYVIGTHHGDEKASTEASLAMIDDLSRNQARYARILEQFSFLIQPLANPDGHALTQRHDSQGLDLNRAYPYPGEQKERQIPTEVQSIRKALRTFPVSAALAIHSGMEGVLWPWCHTSEPNPHHDEFHWLSNQVAKAMSVPIARQSYHDYPTRGEFIDYAYMTQKILALTLEVSQESNPQPSKLKKVVARAIEGFRVFASSLQDERIAAVIPHNRAPTRLADAMKESPTGNGTH